MHIIIQLGACERSGIECDQMKLAVLSVHGEDSCKSIIRSVSFHYKGCTGNPMRENGGGHKGHLECFESLSAFGSEIPGGALLGESCEGNCDIRVATDEPMIEIGETEEGLYVVNLSRFGPILGHLDLLSAHLESIQCEDVT